MNNIKIIEGFDLVGKDTLIEKFFDISKMYRMDYETIKTVYSWDDAWVSHYSILHYLSAISPDETLILNRCFISSLVYSEGAKSVLRDNLEMIVDIYRNFDIFQNAQHYHVIHKNKKNAKILYDNGMKRTDNNELDDFEDFESYWVSYLEAEKKFNTYYKLLGITPKYINAFSKEEDIL